MRRQEIVDALASHREEIRRFNVRSLSLFGSAARDELHPSSDLDFVVELDGPATLSSFMGLKLFLEDLLGRRVDLVTSRAMKQRLRHAIESELLRVA